MKRQSVLLLVIFFFIPFLSWSQGENMDIVSDLMMKNAKVSDSDKEMILSRLSNDQWRNLAKVYIYYRNSNDDSLKQFFSSQYQELLSFEEEGYQGLLSFLRGVYYKNVRLELDSAIVEFNKSSSEFRSMGETQLEMRSESFRGFILIDIQKYSEAYSLFQNMLNEYEGIDDYTGMALTSNNIAHLLLQIELLELARVEVENAIDFAQKHELQPEIYRILLSTAGEIYRAQEDYERASSILKELDGKYIEIDPELLWIEKIKLYIDQNLFTRTLDLIDSLNYPDYFQNNPGRVNYYINRLRLYEAIALDHTDRKNDAFDLLSKIEPHTIYEFIEKRYYYQLFSSLLRTFGEYEQAANLSKEYNKILNDRIDQNSWAEIQQTIFRENVEIIEERNSLLTNQLDSEKEFRLFLLIFTSVSFILLVVILFQYRSIRRSYTSVNEKNRQIEEQQEALEMAHKELQMLNLNLEKLVDDRTRELEEKNRKLESYAFLNSHKLQSFVSRIQGLIILSDAEDDIKKKLELEGLIKAEMKELDLVVQKINVAIREGISVDNLL